ncbi:MAG: glycogen/starch synthase [Candidatus Amulumruptor caecigallinarius]|nr:glycogen/starch synthase [Candidatus Amulumruptor caecigallinarius]
MAVPKIIFVSQEISPYLSVTENGQWGRTLPHAIQQRKYEVRTFMPDFGNINERRNQLHEVIRLSGMNIVIGENDHPLIVKVASMQPSRIQVYFIDNDDYFQKLASDVDAFGTNREDNDERMIFFARGTMETVRKLRWESDIMQVSGWMSSLVPLYMRTVFSDGPSFHKTKLIYSILPEEKVGSLDCAMFDKLRVEGIPGEVVEKFSKEEPNHNLLHKIAIGSADAVVFHAVEPDPELVAYCEANGKAWCHFAGEGDHAEDYDALYKSLMPED